MDAITPSDQIPQTEDIIRPSMEEAMDAVRTLLAWAGDDPRREGLIDTPKRVAKAYKEFFAGYEMDPAEVLERTFEDVQGYDDLVMLRDIDVVFAVAFDVDVSQ
ncbi:MAG: GTP cyclohydrolase I, partial [Pseudomonadota bacterium]